MPGTERRPHGYHRFEAVRVGPGAAEVLWPVVRRLQRSSVDRLTGELAGVFDRTVYASVPTAPDAARPIPVVFGTRGIRPGPLMVELRTPTGFSFAHLDDRRESTVSFRLRESGSVLAVELGAGLTATMPLEALPTLPAAGGLYERYDAETLAEGSPIQRRNRRLVDTLRTRGVEDGLGLLEPVGQWHRGDVNAHLDRLVTAFCATLRDESWRETGSAIPRPLTALLGRGPGATPSGDDVLVGALLVLQGLADDSQRRRARELAVGIARRGETETTTQSAALLHQAARRRAADPAMACARSLTRAGPDAAACRAVATRLLETGHTSGADSLVGMVLAATAVVPRLAAEE